jgi:hypothetical protein
MEMIKVKYPKNDNQYHEVIIKSVDESSFTGNNGWLFYAPKDSKVKPKIGTIARFYGRGIGHTVRGLFLDGEEVFYKTELQEKIAQEKQIEDDKIKRQKEYESKNIHELDARYERLPEVFRKRLDKYRNTNPNFRRDYETYELFCCEQAVIFSQTFNTIEALDKWYPIKEYNNQKLQCPLLSNDHSGNTFGMAVRLARWYLTNPENVIKEHGALTPLVGCEEYGCPHDKTQ